MKKVLFLAAAAVLVATAAPRAETWKGTIGDSMCAAKHSAEKHGDKAADHRSCVEKCINGGGKYVFLSEGKVYQIANQDFAGLKTHAAHEVLLTGEMKSDTITVAKIETPEKK
ncbi:MAG TPA: hypothetical protein VD833_07965 [Vicinamibacterales bacterium]|nr:hypothetical protein [Vicinamibacterales bacterium]